MSEFISQLREPSPQEELKFAAAFLDSMAETALEHGFHLRPAVLKAMLEMTKGQEKILPKDCY